MKGVWVRNSIAAVQRGELSAREAMRFGLARLRPKPLSLELQGILFERVDHTFWGILADVFINQVYFERGMRLEPDGIVVDIGAHRGGFTSFAARKTSSGVLAYEPNPENFASLKQLITVNQLNNVQAFNLAVAAQSGTSYLYISPKSSRHNIYGRDIGKNHKLTDKIKVECLSLDDCLKELGEVDFLKMDCEGAETEILLRAGGDTLKKIRKLSVEIHDPTDSPMIAQLRARIGRSFPHVKIIRQSRELGYLYAHH